MNIYLISAESFHQINNELKKIIKDKKYLTFNMNKISLQSVIEEASYFSIGDEEKILVVTNASFFGSEKIDEKGIELLEKYLVNPNPNTVLIFTTTTGIDSRKKIVKMIKDSGGLINIPKLDKREINNILTKYVANHEYRIDYKTVNYIMDNSYNNLDVMFNELDKIMLYYSFPGTIKYEDVTNIVGEELDSNNFHFVSSVIEKNLKKALKILNSLKVYKVESTALVSLLAREYRLMYYVKKLNGNQNKKDIMNYLSLQEWQFDKLYLNGNKYTLSELENNLVMLCNIDLNIKKGIWDKDTALYGFLLDACS